MIKCQHCGSYNRQGVIFCTQCRSKLDLNAHPDRDMLSRLPPRRGGKLIFAILAVMLGIPAWLAFHPAEFEPGDIRSDEFRRAVSKLNYLLSESGTGQEIFSEGEINAYMAAVAARARKTVKSGPVARRITGVSVALGNGVMAVKTEAKLGPLVLGPLELGPIMSTYELVGVPAAGENGFRFHLKSGRVGRLPLPRLLSLPLFSETEAFFSECARERAFLDKIGRIEIVKEGVVISMTAARPGSGVGSQLHD